jgi:hypothetical protein
MARPDRHSVTPDMADFAERLRALRSQRNINQARFDELAGRVEATKPASLHNPELHQLCQQVDELPDGDQQALMEVIRRLVTSSRVSRAVGIRPQARRRSGKTRASG